MTGQTGKVFIQGRVRVLVRGQLLLLNQKLPVVLFLFGNIVLLLLHFLLEGIIHLSPPGKQTDRQKRGSQKVAAMSLVEIHSFSAGF